VGSVTIIGLGYVGLPLAISAANAGYLVRGIDNDRAKISKLKLGESTVEDIPNSILLETLSSERLILESTYDDINSSDIIIICVPTPLLQDRPDLSYVFKVIEEIATRIQKGSLVILESTVQPGTTRNFLMPNLIKYSGFKESEIDVAFSPERVDPVNKKWTIKNTPKIVSGLTLKSKERAVKFYSGFIDEIFECNSVEVAETAKLLENTFRFINISFINEFALMCNKLGIEVNEVIAAASSKPYGFMPFLPSIGVGGHCIPVDPIYLASRAHEVGATTKFIDLAVEINRELPTLIVKQIEQTVGRLLGKSILVVGVAYKPNVSDVRETPVEGLILSLESRGAIVNWHDDLVKEWNGSVSVPLSDNYDFAIIAVRHDYLDLTKLVKVPIINTVSIRK
jgi:UDP-N-acetyl-D-glucosamine dehydrogenase